METDVPKLNWIVASIHNLGLEELRDPDVEKCPSVAAGGEGSPGQCDRAQRDPNFCLRLHRVIQEFRAKSQAGENQQPLF